MAPIDAFTPMTEAFHAATGQWFGQLFQMANWVFTLLVTAEIVTTMMLRLGSGAFFWTILMDRLFRLCFFKFVLFNAGWLIPSVINGFVYAGSTASGAIGDLNPESIFVQGIGIAAKLCYQMAGWGFYTHPLESLLGFFVAACIIVAYIVIAGQLFLTLIESYIVCGAGVFMLGFGGWHGTSEIANRFMSYIVAVGTKLFMLYLIIGLGASLANIWAQMINEVTIMNFYTEYGVLGGIVGFALVAWKIPSVTSSLLTGALGMGLQEAIETTSFATRMVTSTAAAPVVSLAAAGQAVGIGKATAASAGGGWSGALAGAKAGGGALVREAASASVPRLSRGMGNLQKQHQDLKKKP
jgi:type IV secretion system protein TrbL